MPGVALHAHPFDKLIVEIIIVCGYVRSLVEFSK